MGFWAYPSTSNLEAPTPQSRASGDVVNHLRELSKTSTAYAEICLSGHCFSRVIPKDFSGKVSHALSYRHNPGPDTKVLSCRVGPSSNDSSRPGKSFKLYLIAQPSPDPHSPSTKEATLVSPSLSKLLLKLSSINLQPMFKTCMFRPTWAICEGHFSALLNSTIQTFIYTQTSNFQFQIFPPCPDLFSGTSCQFTCPKLNYMHHGWYR